MGRVLFIRVSAVTYDEKTVRQAWPFLTDLAWPKPSLLEQAEDDEDAEPDDYEKGDYEDDYENVKKDAPDGDRAGDDSRADDNGKARQEAASPDSSGAGPERPEGEDLPVNDAAENLKGEAKGDQKIPSAPEAKKEGWKFRMPWSKKPDPAASGAQAAKGDKKAASAKSAAQHEKTFPKLEDMAPKSPHGVLDLIDRLADLEHKDLELELMHILDEYVPKLTGLRRELDSALADWDVKHAHKLTNIIEDTLDAAEKACYY